MPPASPPTSARPATSVAARLLPGLMAFAGTAALCAIRTRRSAAAGSSRSRSDRGGGGEDPVGESTESSPSPQPSSGGGFSSMSKAGVAELRSRHFCGAVSLSYGNSDSLMIVGGRGSRLLDSSGRSYLDTRNNVAHVGHGHPSVAAAVSRQVESVNSNTRYLHPNASLLASRLAGLLPDPLEVVFLVNSGSEANDLALRLARCYSGSENVVVVGGAYHGHTLACLEVSPYKYEKSKEFAGRVRPQSSGRRRGRPDEADEGKGSGAGAGAEDLPGAGGRAARSSWDPPTPSPRVFKVPCPRSYRGLHRSDRPTTLADQYASYVRDACNACATRGEKVGAFLVEGGMSVAGVVLPPTGYLRMCADAVRAAGGLYVADEVQTGFGRLGDCYWAFQHGWGEGGEDDEDCVVPDIVTVGKPFGNGMPLAAVVTTRAVSDSFEAMGVEYFNTFGGNPVCCAAGLAVIDAVEREELMENARVVGAYLKGRFRDLQQRLGILGDVRGSGLFLGIELVRDRTTLEPASAETSFLCTALKERYGILTSIDGPDDNVLVVKPPMVFSREDADLFAESFERAVTEDLAKVGDVRLLGRTPT